MDSAVGTLHYDKQPEKPLSRPTPFSSVSASVYYCQLKPKNRRGRPGNEARENSPQLALALAKLTHAC